MATRQKDGVGRAAVLAAVAMLLPWIVVALVGLVMAAHGMHQDRDAIQWMARLDLSAPALWTAGSAQRTPQALPRAVDLRISPFFDWQTEAGPRPPRLPSPGVIR